MKELGYWILLTFFLYYIIALFTGGKNTMGALVLGAILSTGIVLAFL